MKTCVQQIVVTAALAVCGFFYPALAVPLWNVDFNHMPTGVPPVLATAVGGIVNTNPSTLTISGSLNSVIVQDSFTAGTAALTDKPIVWTQVAQALNDPVGSSALTFYFVNAADYESPADYFIEFDLLVRAGATSQPLSFRVYNKDGMILRTYFDKDGDFVIVPSSILYPYTEYASFTAAWNYNEVTRVRVYFNSAVGSFTFKMNGRNVGTAYIADWSAVPLNNRGVKQIIFASWTINASATLAIDNFSSVPFPSGTLISFE